jgi:CheY-like chemotaxis protein
MKILIVDDDATRSQSLGNFLVDENGLSPEDVRFSSNMDDAVNNLTRFHFDVAILDVVIPKRDGETPDSKWAFALLRKINRSSSIRKPGKIIGITGYLEDLGRFKARFEEYCLVVIEANRNTAGWRKKIAQYVGYDFLAQAHRELSNRDLNIITIHGIRTFGHWQNRLRDLVHLHLAELPFYGYRYGYMSFLALFSRAAHNKYIDIFRGRLLSIIEANPEATFTCFAHSFGTFLLIETLKRMAQNNEPLPFNTIVLCGSVLKSRYDLSFLRDHGIRTINDCAHSDYVLWLSEAFVPGLGMAGKVGFYGFEDSLSANRFFLGGHSSYFKGDDFMKNNWLPVIACVDDIKCVDLRTSTAFKNDLVEQFVISLGNTKDRLASKFRALMEAFSSL